MEDNTDYLKYIYNEDLYIIDVSSREQNYEIEKEADLTEKSDSTPMVEAPEPISFFGKNEQGILILVNDPADELLNQSDLDLLMKIVESGLKLTKNDFALVNAAKYSIHQIFEDIGYSTLIAFGVDLNDYYSNSALYTVHQIDEHKVLFSEALADLAADETKKRQLWNALKSMFNLK